MKQWIMIFSISVLTVTIIACGPAVGRAIGDAEVDVDATLAEIEPETEAEKNAPWWPATERRLLEKKHTLEGKMYGLIYAESTFTLTQPKEIPETPLLDDNFLPIPEPKERGAASLKLELSKSVITIRHGSSDEVLSEFRAVEGDWKSICSQLSNLAYKRGSLWLNS